MPKPEKRLTEFGHELHKYCLYKGCTIKSLCEQSGANYRTTSAAARGHTQGHKVKEALYAIINGDETYSNNN